MFMSHLVPLGTISETININHDSPPPPHTITLHVSQVCTDPSSELGLVLMWAKTWSPIGAGGRETGFCSCLVFTMTGDHLKLEEASKNNGTFLLVERGGHI